MLVAFHRSGASWEVPDRQALTRIETQHARAEAGAARHRRGMNGHAACLSATQKQHVPVPASCPSQGGQPCGARAAASSQASASCATKLRPPFRWARRHARPGVVRSVLTASSYQQVRFEAELRHPSYGSGPDAGAQR